MGRRTTTTAGVCRAGSCHWRSRGQEAVMIRLILLALLVGILELLGCVQPPVPAPQPLKAPAPVDAIAGIAGALRSYPVVGLSPGEGHGDARGPEFFGALIRDPRITAVATDIVMEGANARYQAVMDRYTRG